IGRPSTYAPTVSTILDREYVVKEGKALRPTPLGEVVNGLMMDKFTDIVDPDFTAKMEAELDNVEVGKENWKEVLSQFYEGFSQELAQAERDLDGERIKIPAEESDEICDVCGRRMVVKSGRFGRFLACPGYPECTFTKPLVIEMPGKCPKCGSRILKKTSKKGYTYYGCERNKVVKGEPCDFMTWDVPVKDNCPVCGKTMFKLSGRGFKKPFCINESCSNFLPEDQRGYRKKKEEGAAAGEGGTSAAESAPSTKAAAKGKKAATAKTAAKKTAAKKPAAKKSAARSADKPKRERTPAQIAATERMRAALAAKKAAEKAAKEQAEG
ncbi:MAG: topoisomerase DNA-binding C4 zinc finger domain-containing protein, partial [Oscillospiraceae bacterium]|nr:topoisomerase DNA-binding C4 zinc finger domain-containing protein [Oscillospiraceae bacterium]